MLCESHGGKPESDGAEVPPKSKKRRLESETPVEGEARPTFGSVEEYLGWLRTITYEEARGELLRFPGIGPKVAE